VESFGKRNIDLYKEFKDKNVWNRDFAHSYADINSFSMFQRICTNNNLNQSLLLDCEFDPQAYYVLFLANNPIYQNLSDPSDHINEISILINKICSDQNYRDLNNSKPLVVAMQNVYSYAQKKCGTPTALYDLTWDELGGCLVAGIGAYIGSNYSAIKSAWALLNGSGFTFGNVKSVLQLLFPQMKAASAIIGTAACIIKEWIW
jgi:hypothetical protein